MAENDRLVHTRPYLAAVLAASKTAFSPGRHSSSTHLSHLAVSTPAVSLSVGTPGRASFDSSDGSRSSFSSSRSGEDDVSPRSRFRDSVLTPTPLTPTLSTTPVPAVSTSEATTKILNILAKSDEDEQPEQLKGVLSSLLPGMSSALLDDVVLSLLHRHREDLNPTGQRFDPLPPSGLYSNLGPIGSTAPSSPSNTPGTSPVRRSGSLRRSGASSSGTAAAAAAAAQASHQQALGLHRNHSGLLNPGGLGAGSRPASPSPLRAASPSPMFTRAVTASAAGLPFSGPGYLGSAALADDDDSPGGLAERSGSPFGSPRGLHAGASEFRPSSAPGVTPGLGMATKSPVPPSVLALSSFGGSSGGSRSNTPGGEGRNVWAFGASPLGTPKFALPPAGTVGVIGSATASAAGTPTGGGPGESYFPTLGALEGRSGAGSGAGTPTRLIPRDPWKDVEQEGLPEEPLLAAADGSAGAVDVAAAQRALELVARLDDDYGDADAGEGFGPKPPVVIMTTSVDADTHQSAMEWGMSPSMANEMARFSSWDPFDADTDAEMLSWDSGARVLPDSAAASSSEYLTAPQAGDGHNLYAQGHATMGGGYTMTPFDELYAAVAGTGVTPEQMEDALVMCGYDAMEAMEYLIAARGMSSAGAPGEEGDFGLAPAKSPPRTRLVPFVPGSGNRPTLVSRDSFDRRGNGARSPIGSAPSSPRYNIPGLGPGPRGPGAAGHVGEGNGGPRSMTPIGDRSVGPSNRVCRFYLQGGCLRSDCRFSHDVGKAVCRFWLRGHCLKGENRCDFLHEIPDIANARLAVLDAKNEYRRSPSWKHSGGGPTGGYGRRGDLTGFDSDEERQHNLSAESGADELVAFPSLGEAAESRRGKVPNDPSRTRWAGAVKTGRAMDPAAARQALEARKAARAGLAGGDHSGDEKPVPEFRPSKRMSLRPPALVPTLPTGSALAQLYATYRAGFLDLGSSRNRCFQKANECFRRGDGAGAKRWSREGDEWNRRVIEEGRHAASAILQERNRLCKDAVASMDRVGRADEVPDRMHRGREQGGGVCLGVANPAIIRNGEGERLSAKERMEVMMDLHGLHPGEAVDFLERFLLSLNQDGYLGLAYVVVGEAKHTGTSDPARGSGRVRLADAVMHYLARTRYPWRLFDGVICIDPCR